jgi:hypothetical protein
MQTSKRMAMLTWNIGLERYNRQYGSASLNERSTLGD